MSSINWSEYLEHSRRIALFDGERTLDYATLLDDISRLRDWLSSTNVRVVGLDLDNSIEWVLFDLALLGTEFVCVPIPQFFTATQRDELIKAAGVEMIVTQRLNSHTQCIPGTSVNYYLTSQPRAQLPEGTAKITFTSGSTAAPKGVCLSSESQLNTALSLSSAVAIDKPVHLSLLPYATLLENLAGIVSPLLSNGVVNLPKQAQLGFSGSRLVEPSKLLSMLSMYQPDTLILVPELLSLMVLANQNGWRVPTSLHFVAVGGAKVSQELLFRAERAGIPVYQGYGLSECCSVVTLNTPSANRTGSVGRRLSHLDSSLVEREMVVSGNIFLGYLGDETSWYPTQVKTGDLLTEDEEGFYWFDGRIKNQIISSFGRNISPEWPEAELLNHDNIQQAVILGDGMPYCVAILTVNQSMNAEQVQKLLDSVNTRLPDYAQVKKCLVLNKPMTVSQRLYTENGRPNRANINHFYKDKIDWLYKANDQVIIDAEFSPEIIEAIPQES
jgi:long-subunit acyl-CoA synthetase (AMP-forming)